jgi:diaminopimelate decarboxylase
MTIVDPLPGIRAAASTPHWRRSIRTVRRTLLFARMGVPASVLRDPLAAASIRAQRADVHTRGDGDLELACSSGIEPAHIVLRCGPQTETTKRAVALGIRQFIVTTPGQIDTLARCARPTNLVYLDEHAPGVFGETRLQIVGLHADVDVSGGDAAWGRAAERLLCRIESMKRCGLALGRISLTGGTVAPWRDAETAALVATATAIDNAVEEGCARWRLPRPVVAVGPLG